MKLIVGLGNPGQEYAYTRHNVGFLLLDTLHNKLNAPPFKSQFKGLVSKGKHGSDEYLLLKPLTYMNLSGESVLEAVSFYKIKVEDIIVVYDDMNFDVGVFSIRELGGHGGHNGMRNIIDHLKTQNFKRIRIGIGKEFGDKKSSHVLGKFSKSELEILKVIIFKLCDALTESLSTPFPKIMTKYNTKEAK